MRVEVFLWNIKVGVLEWDNNTSRSIFSFSEEYLDSPYDISPFLYPKTHKGKLRFYGSLKSEGLPEFIADSLPDDWGNILFDKWATRNHYPLNDSRTLAKLSFIGTRAMGALEFRPAMDELDSYEQISVNELYEEALYVLRDRQNASINAEERTLTNLIRLGTSVGGKHAKGLIAINDKGDIRSGQIPLPNDFKYYILKFKEEDNVPTSEIEKVFYDMALECGIKMSDSSLWEVNNVNHFLTERFDRKPGGEKVYMQTVNALAPDSNDYTNIFWLTDTLKVSSEDKERLYRQMIFNQFAGVTDDHTKNFSFLMNKEGQWSLSPAYDLMFTANTWQDPSAYAHCLGINGKRAYVTKQELIEFGQDFDIFNSENIVEQVTNVVSTFLEKTKKYDIPKQWSERIWSVIEGLLPKQILLTNCQEDKDLEAIIKKKFNNSTVQIVSKESLFTDKKKTGELIHFTLNGKKRTCVSDYETKDICISKGFIKKGEFYFGTWNTIYGKPATYSFNRVFSWENAKKK